MWGLRAVNIEKDRVAQERVVIRYMLLDINFAITPLAQISIPLGIIVNV